ncbi:hypothetical protein A1OO_16320 [Enterovibrio norvegicus FF-33]|nr:hypothetical protein A1OO_16320 [Enterovibrio norvegicus FF-33]
MKEYVRGSPNKTCPKANKLAIEVSNIGQHSGSFCSGFEAEKRTRDEAIRRANMSILTSGADS